MKSSSLCSFPAPQKFKLQNSFSFICSILYTKASINHIRSVLSAHFGHPSYSFFFFSSCNIIGSSSLKTQTIFFPSLFLCYSLNSSPLPGPFAVKRSERILEFHQLPSPLDVTLMNWRAHTYNTMGEKMTPRCTRTKWEKVSVKREEVEKWSPFLYRSKQCDLSKHQSIPPIWFELKPTVWLLHGHDPTW